MNYGMNLKSVLDEKGMTIYRLAKKTGISATTLYSSVQRNSGIRYDYALKIAEVLGIEPDLICSHIPANVTARADEYIERMLAGMRNARKKERICRYLPLLMAYDEDHLEAVGRVLEWFGRVDPSEWDYIHEMMDAALRYHPAKAREEKMDWRSKLKETVGVTDEKGIVDLTDMEGREILDEQHLKSITDSRTEINRTDSDVTECDSHV